MGRAWVRAGVQAERSKHRFARSCIVASTSLLFAVLLVGGMPAVASAGGQGNTRPILECVWHDTRTGQYNSLWGYDNQSGQNDSASIRSNNNFSPSPQNRGQPTSFAQGTKHSVFVVTWNGSGSLTWNLEGVARSATSVSTKCATNPVPIIPSPFSSWTGPAILAALVLAGGLLIRWRGQPERRLSQ